MTARCKVGALLETLPAEDRPTLEREADPKRATQPATVLAEALTLEGHPVSPTTVKDHRGRRCACARGRTAA